MAPGAHEDHVWDAAAGRDPDREARDIEAAIAAALARNTRLGRDTTASRRRSGLTAWSH